MLKKTALTLVMLSTIGCSGLASHSNENAKMEPVDHSQKAALVKDDISAQGLLVGDLQVNTAASGEINVTLQYSNQQSYGVPLMFTSGMVADLWLFDPEGHKVWTWSSDMMFSQAIRETVIAAGKTQSVQFTIAAPTALTIKKGFYIQAVFAGKATESKKPAMVPVRYQF
ncbi:BsuPI-related putative proteinase inhibitor [Shewanella youngdeokensis]|uniref:Intracellular proteinase inhibitor BsuPI domain-containing protein n=1 Tax=Shewanella youngdeokensis TaxID=2999068 RepID=A0ABZ0JTU8_9GAMM|nr:BsuPI-related putative proteinase inhibitor [Shewanella sp. DAU334]